MKSILILIQFCFLLNSYGQDIAKTVLNKPLKSIHKTADFISTDRLGNLYLAHKNFLWMYDKNGDSLRSFNSNRYGEISYIDVTDPYKILLFFQDYNVLLFLDNYLSENGVVLDMQELGFDQASLVCLSQENGFWVFDQLKQKIMRLDQSFRKTHETVNFIQWFGRRLEPNFMIQFNNRLYLNEKESGVYIFDHFGTYIKKIPLKGIDNLQLLEGIISYVEEGKYCNYHLQKLEKECDSLSIKDVYGARKEKGRFYLHTAKKVNIYKTN